MIAGIAFQLITKQKDKKYFGNGKHIVQILITRESFWTRLSSTSPCLMVD